MNADLLLLFTRPGLQKQFQDMWEWSFITNILFFNNVFLKTKSKSPSRALNLHISLNWSIQASSLVSSFACFTSNIMSTVTVHHTKLQVNGPKVHWRHLYCPPPTAIWEWMKNLGCKLRKMDHFPANPLISLSPFPL